MIETVTKENTLISWRKKINPVWWLMNGETWTAPITNNDAPYIPEVTNQLHRDFYWWCRNPAANFFEYVVGICDRTFTVTGPAPAMQTTWYDSNPREYGWKWAVLSCSWVRLPFVSYSGKRVLWYLGWRPGGGLGFKFNVHL